MVRVNPINPRCLADQHLVAEYAEILILVASARKHPSRAGIPPTYRLGKGHQLFFRDKLMYLKRRHERLKREMRKRGFHPRKTLGLQGLPASLKRDWRPRPQDKLFITKRLLWKIRQKPKFYRYYGKQRPMAFFQRLLRETSR